MSESRPSVPSTAARIMAEQEYLRAMLYRRVVAVPPAGRALFIEPHPDDAVIGCGGVMQKYVAAKIPVQIVTLTDGRACVAAPAARAAMAERRAEETRAVARALGIPPPELYLCPEDRFTQPELRSGLVTKLRASLEASAADAVFIPFELEVHPLHRYASHLLAVALDGMARSITVHAYAVASLPPPAIVVDITGELARKHELVGMYASQIELRDYRQDLDLLNGYCAPLAGAGARACEVYYDRPRDRFVSEILALGLDAVETLTCGIQPQVSERGGISPA
jgi:LmbE family N-acetylglucosaminyl deacetylase